MAIRQVLRLLSLTGLFGLAATAHAASNCPQLLNHQMSSLQGKPANLCQFSGRVLLIVNTASYCGNTPQYAGLEKLQEQLQARGLTVLGFPANDFGAQEPDSNAQIAQFCKLTYKVKFPMMEKSGVTRSNANPVFAQLIAATGDEPEWNFHKYLVSRDGKTVQSFPASMQPDDPKILRAIEQLLAQP